MGSADTEGIHRKIPTNDLDAQHNRYLMQDIPLILHEYIGKSRERLLTRLLDLLYSYFYPNLKASSCDLL